MRPSVPPSFPVVIRVVNASAGGLPKRYLEWMVLKYARRSGVDEDGRPGPV